MAKKAEQKKQESNRIALYVAKYSNTSTGNNYKGSIEGFLRCIYSLDKKGDHDYEKYFDQYLSETSRNRSADIKKYSECLVRESVSRQSARQRLTYAVKVLKAHGVTVNQEDVQDIKRECKGGAATVDKVLTHDVICKTLRGSDIQMRALILTLASSGIRIGELLQIEMSDFDFNMNPIMINVRAEIAKNGYARYTFISTEATEALKEYLKVRDSFIEKAETVTAIAREYREADKGYKGKIPSIDKDSNIVFPITDSSVNKKWETLLKKAGLFSRDARSKRNQYRIHSLRKFFISQMSLAGSKTLAEHLAGHTGYLDQSYRQVSPEFASREYQKIQSELICCQDATTKNTIKAITEKNAVLSEKVEMHEIGYEGLKIQNQQLQTAIKAQQKAIEDITKIVSRLLEEKQNVVAYDIPVEQNPKF